MTAHTAAGRIADQYYLDARIFTDPHIFQEELDKLFGHAWLFLGHECEAKAPDSYFCFEIGGTPVVVCRNAAEARIESRFVLFETRNLDGVSKLSYVGCYEDAVVQEDNGGWWITSRRVMLDTFNFRSLMIPL